MNEWMNVFVGSGQNSSCSSGMYSKNQTGLQNNLSFAQPYQSLLLGRCYFAISGGW